MPKKKTILISASIVIVLAAAIYGQVFFIKKSAEKNGAMGINKSPESRGSAMAAMAMEKSSEFQSMIQASGEGKKKTVTKESDQEKVIDSDKNVIEEFLYIFDQTKK